MSAVCGAIYGTRLAGLGEDKVVRDTLKSSTTVSLLNFTDISFLPSVVFTFTDMSNGMKFPIIHVRSGMDGENGDSATVR